MKTYRVFIILDSERGENIRVHCFDEEQIKELSKNNYVEKINEKTIKFTNEFKEEFLRLYKQGVNPVSIFRELGINPKIIGQVRIDKFTYRIKAQASRPEGFSRKENSSKGKRRKLSFKSKDEELEYYKELSEKLAQENEFLKKLKALKNTK